MHMLCKVRSENGYAFLRPALKTGVENGIFWSEIGSGFGDAGGTPSRPPWFKYADLSKMRKYFGSFSQGLKFFLTLFVGLQTP